MRELVKDYPAWDCETDEFDHTVTVWKEGDNYYQHRHSGRNGPFDLDSFPTPIPIPMQLFMGRWHTSLTEAPKLIPTDSFLKSPPILLTTDYNLAEIANADEQDSSNWTPGDALAAEANIYEILKQHTHPNISVYYGCVRDGDYFTALCLKKYGRSLYDAILNGDPTLKPDVVLDGISKGLHFLHDTLGLVHNDINPSNIMLDDKGNAVIIDFDSCLPIGQEIGFRKGGTFGWTMQPEPSISAPESDMHGLKLIAKFMEEKYTSFSDGPIVKAKEDLRT